MLVIKLGGSAGLDYEAFLDDLARVDEPTVFIHGGNAEFDRVSKQLGLEPRHVTSQNGQSSRFTDRETLDVMLMVYCGKINKKLVEGLQRRGINAVGLSAIDGRIATGRRKPAIRVLEDGKPKMLRGDYAGSIEDIDTGLLTLLLGAGYLPVLTPPALGREGEAINVDGDKLATELAVALGADQLLVFSNTPGLLADLQGREQPRHLDQPGEYGRGGRDGARSDEEEGRRGAGCDRARRRARHLRRCAGRAPDQPRARRGWHDDHRLTRARAARGLYLPRRRTAAGKGEGDDRAAERTDDGGGISGLRACQRDQARVL